MDSRLKTWLLLSLFVSLNLIWVGQIGPTEAQIAAPNALTPISWQRQVLDPRGYSGQFSDLALDSNGYAHIAYSRSEGISSILFYARWDGVTWQKERVDNTLLLGNQVSIMLDAQQRPHIAYQDSANQDLYYAFRDDGGWHTTQVATVGTVGRYNNIALTGQGVAITYLNETQGEIDIVFGAVGSLTFGLPQRVAQTTTLGQHGLAVNSQGRPGVSYHDTVNGDLMLATQQISGAWAIETVGDFGDVGVTSSLAYDSSDTPHVTGSVFYQNRYFLNYYTFNGSTWLDEAVDGDVNLSLGQYHALALDGNGRPVVAYIDSTSRHLKLARRDTPNNWEIQTVDTQTVSRVGGVGVDAADNPIVSSYDNQFGDLVVNSGGSDWQIRTVYNNNAQPNFLPALALNGHAPAVSFHTQATLPNSTQFVGWDGSAWADGVITMSGDAAVTSPLIFDGSGQPHAAYYQSSMRQILFASLVNNIWELVPAVTLPAGSSVGPDLALMLVGLEEYPTLVFSSYSPGVGATLILAQAVDGVWSQTSHAIAGQTAPVAPLAADFHYGGGVSIAYFNGVNSTLNRALFEGTWQEGVVANGVQVTAVSTTVSRRRLSDGAPTNTPTITYYDANANQLVYARLEGVNTWQPYPVATPTSGVESLATVFIGNATVRPRIAAITTDNAVRLYKADGEGLVWSEEGVVAAGTAVRSHVNLAFGDRERLSYLENGFVMHAFRTATTIAPVAPAETSNGMIGMQISFCHCFIAVSWCAEGGLRPAPNPAQVIRPPETAASAALRPNVATSFNNDGPVLDNLTTIFQATPQGEALVNTYITHDFEVAQILIADPLLTWDAFRTMENLMPGLAAFTQGQGGAVIIDQALMDQVLDILQRVAAQAGSALAGEINQYLTNNNNLQDYVGLSFDEWAASLGVEPPPAMQVFLPLVVR
ncbi:MAG: hypothetical protein WAS33_12545 [Candidatus Promineifilaceae bacterium]